jgi:7,8-dihydropterin-6-yl-methyl-4-(beta-D-ribofuranosyl)aminobenzene 5'-phosphate synthase
MLMISDSGGILKALELRQSSSSSSSFSSSSSSLGPLDTLDPLNALPVDLHPERPIRRGIAPPPKRIPIAVLPADPTFEQIDSAGGAVRLSDQPHDIIGRDGGSTGVRVSGEIPRVEPFERGLVGAVTWMKDENGEEGWFTDEVSVNLPATPIAISSGTNETSKSWTSDTSQLK